VITYYLKFKWFWLDLIAKLLKIAWNTESVIGELPSGTEMPMLNN